MYEIILKGGSGFSDRVIPQINDFVISSASDSKQNLLYAIENKIQIF